MLEFESRASSIAVESATETVARTDIGIFTGMWFDFLNAAIAIKYCSIDF